MEDVFAAVQYRLSKKMPRQAQDDGPMPPTRSFNIGSKTPLYLYFLT